MDQVRERQQEADVQRARDEARQRTERRDDELVRRERERDAGDDLPRGAGQLALDAGLVECGFGRLDRDAGHVGGNRHPLSSCGAGAIPAGVT